jgi:hypothetical protein
MLRRLSLIATDPRVQGVHCDSVFVFDPLEERYWGPFAGSADAEAFIESDKYLASWCIAKSRVILGLPVYLPAEYHGEWPLRE